MGCAGSTWAWQPPSNLNPFWVCSAELCGERKLAKKVSLQMENKLLKAKIQRGLGSSRARGAAVLWSVLNLRLDHIRASWVNEEYYCSDYLQGPAKKPQGTGLVMTRQTCCINYWCHPRSTGGEGTFATEREKCFAEPPCIHWILNFTINVSKLRLALRSPGNFTRRDASATCEETLPRGSFCFLTLIQRGFMSSPGLDMSLLSTSADCYAFWDW